jgi:cytidylate kinase
MTGTSDRVVEALARLNRYADTLEGHAKGAPAPISIAISREAGSRGAEIARAVGARLGWPVYDHELLDRIAEQKGLSPRLLEHLDERYVGWLEEAVRAFCLREGGREGSYLKGLVELMASLGKAGHCVIVGRGGPHVLPSATTLRVRVIASRPFRVAVVQKSQNLSAAEAQRWVDAHDRERLRFADRHFGVNAADPGLYDLMLNSERLSVEECSSLIAQAAKALEGRAGLAPAPPV